MSSREHPYAGGAGARYLMMGSALFLTVFGLVMIYSASSITAAVREGSSYHYLLRQAAAIVVSVPLAWWLSRFDYRLLRDRAMMVWGWGVGLLVLTLVIGAVRGGARRWIPLGVFNLQPSELAKIACVLLVASFAVDWMRGRCTQNQLLVRSLAATAIPGALIILQPDLGTTVTLAVAVAFVLLLAGIDWKWVTTSVGFGALLVVIMVLIEPYRMKRILAFSDPWADPLGKGYQTIQAMLAFGTGGIEGVGLGLSRQKFFYLPEAHTDFVLAIIGEEAGLIGTLMVLAGFVIFVWAGMRIAVGAKDPFGKLVSGALTAMIGFQAFLNMAAVTGVIPVTGKPLPFVSYGGSSILVTMICLGLLLSVSQYGALAPRAVAVRKRREGPPRESDDERWRDGRARPSGAERRRTAHRRA